jgi:aspartate/methionine/tyrosine aminotransferase
MEDSRPKIEPSNRSKLIQEYYFSKKLKEVDDLRKKGADIINLGIGSPDLPPSNATLEELNSSSYISGNHGYQSYYGIPELRKAFSSWYRNYFNVELNPENEILPLIGSKEGIMHITMAYLNPGDKVLIPNPGYPTYTSVTKLVGGEVIYYELNEENSWYPDFEKIEEIDLSSVKIMWVNYPHMPTGQKATRKLFARLVEFGHKHNILIVNDNPYSFILNEDYLSILSADGAKDIALELNSLSKSHNMPGWRVGMVAGKSEFISNIIKVKSNMDSGMFKPLQLAATKALSCDNNWYDSVNEVYKRRRVLAESILNKLNCSFDSKQSGLFMWGKVPSIYSSGEELADLMLYNANVFVTPGKVFGTAGDNYIRISLCADEEKLKQTLKRIEEIL